MAKNLGIGQSVIVGREGEIRVNGNPSVSREHCRITRTGERTCSIDDLGSSNGTFVDGLNVISSVITSESHIRLGNFETSLSQLGIALAPVSDKIPHSGGASSSNAPKTVSIGRLFEVYEDYDVSQRDIQKRRARMGMNRMVFMTIPALLGSVGSFLGKQNPNIAIIIGVVSGVVTLGMLIYTLAMPAKSDNLVDEQFDLNQNFQLNYTCPHCKNFLGQRPPHLLIKQGACPFCKTKFTKDKH